MILCNFQVNIIKNIIKEVEWMTTKNDGKTSSNIFVQNMIHNSKKSRICNIRV